jgi:hypothetical protein
MGATHRTCKLDCKLHCDYSFSVGWSCRGEGIDVSQTKTPQRVTRLGRVGLPR